jgi:hypothetical protein
LMSEILKKIAIWFPLYLHIVPSASSFIVLLSIRLTFQHSNHWSLLYFIHCTHLLSFIDCLLAKIFFIIFSLLLLVSFHLIIWLFIFVRLYLTSILKLSLSNFKYFIILNISLKFWFERLLCTFHIF